MLLGTIDKTLYSCISPKISTNEVVITSEQLEHIAKNHNDAYEVVLNNLKDTLSNPDYIIQDDKHLDTGFVIKSINFEDEKLLIILKICTDTKNGRYANSIITGWKISEKRLNNYLRHKKILYKKALK